MACGASGCHPEIPGFCQALLLFLIAVSVFRQVLQELSGRFILAPSSRVRLLRSTLHEGKLHGITPTLRDDHNRQLGRGCSSSLVLSSFGKFELENS